jgi:GNAT superfamily N-acetyltransferase
VRWLAWDGDTAVGLAWVRLHHAEGGRQVADCRISVLGDGYGQGVAEALLAEVVAVAVADGRSDLLTSTPVGSASEEFLVGAGFSLGADFCRLRLRVADCDQDALRATVRAASDGYSLVRWQGVPPSDLLGPFAATREAMNDVPADAPDHLVWDEDRLRANARSAADRGRTLLTVAALGLDEAGAEVVAGFSEIVLEGSGSVLARQSDTVVLRGHRGRGLGLWVKAAMLEWLIGAHPEVEEVLTACLVSNTHMIAINEQIGFRPVNGERHYRLAL